MANRPNAFTKVCLTVLLAFATLVTPAPAAVQKFAKGPGHPGIFGYGLRGWKTRSYARPQVSQPTRPAPNYYTPPTTPRRGPVNRFYR